MYFNYEPITNPEEVIRDCECFSKEKYLAFDTEFVRTNTFFPKLSLIQIASSKKTIIIDTLSLSNDELYPVLELLKSEKIKKVFHAPRQDFEIFQNLFHQLPKNIFDTQISSSLSGLGEQVSYDFLVQQLCKKEINKNVQFSNWFHRPLTKEQILYALNDVFFLRIIYEKLTIILNKLGRLNWAYSESKNFLNKNLYDNDPSIYWKKIKYDKSKKISISQLKELTQWRENICIEDDIARNKFLSDKKIINTLSLNYNRDKQIDYILSLNLIKKHEDNLINATEKICNDYINKDFEKIDKSKLNHLKKILKKVSEKEKIPSSLIATVADLKKFLIDAQKCPQLLSGWRFEIFGRYIVNIDFDKILSSEL